MLRRKIVLSVLVTLSFLDGLTICVFCMLIGWGYLCISEFIAWFIKLSFVYLFLSGIISIILKININIREELNLKTNNSIRYKKKLNNIRYFD